MMLLRNLVLVTLLAASATATMRDFVEATCGQSKVIKADLNCKGICANKSHDSRECTIARYYNQAGMEFDDNVKAWMTSSIAQRKSPYTPMYCFLAYDSNGDMASNQGSLGYNKSQMLRLAQEECIHAKFFGPSQERRDEECDDHIRNANIYGPECQQWLYKVDAYSNGLRIEDGQEATIEYKFDWRKAKESAASARKRAGNSSKKNGRKSIETAKNSQKTTGSSDNTVLIVVVALLSVFALAVGVWVGRLSSEMKIPQDAQMGPVGIETV